MSRNELTRRKFVGGSAAIVAGGVTATLFSGTAVKAATAVKPVSGVKACHDLFKYHCSLVHKAMSDKLTGIVADPDISAADTAHALRTTFCPCCNTQINATYPIVPWGEVDRNYA